MKYFAADGTQLNKKYFEKQEGKIDIKPSGRYSITKAGKTRYFAANGVELKETYFKKVENPDVIVKTNGKNYNLNKSIEKRINKVTSDLKKAEDENGLIGKAWSWAKNTGGFGDSSNKVREQQKKEQQLLAQFNSNPQRRGVIFKQLTGADYTPENLEKFIKGQILLRSECALRGYKEGQEMAVDVVADVVSGVVSFGVYTAAVAAAPFTGGASIAVGVAAAAGTGALVKTGLKYADAKSGGRDYTLKDAGHDAATGAFSGALAPVTAGAGGAVGKVVTVQAGKAGLKAGAAKAVAFTAEVAADGALGGGVDNAFRTAVDGGSAEEIFDAGITGAKYGAVLGPVMGWGAKGLGKTYKVTKGVLKKADDVVPTPTVKRTRAELKEKIASGKKVNVTQGANIKVPKGRLRAPSAKFAETDEAFVNIISRNQAKMLELHMKYKATGNKERFISDVYDLFVKEMDLEGVAPNLKIKRDFGEDGNPLGGYFKAEERTIHINPDNSEDFCVEAIAHELNHFLQFKEMVVTHGYEEGIDIYAYNSAISTLKKEDLLDFTQQSELDEFINETVKEKVELLRSLWSDLLTDRRYPHNTNLNDYHFRKANMYYDATSKYTNEGPGYRQNALEEESFRRGGQVSVAYQSLKNQSQYDIDINMQAINAIKSRIRSCDAETQDLLIELAIEHIYEPRFNDYSVGDFVNWFMNKYTN